jgi:uncharacterized membrane protein
VGNSVVGGVYYATEWSGGRVLNLGVGQAGGVNDIGQVVGKSGGVATEWTGGSVITLGTLQGTTSSAAYGINNVGQIVGYSIVGGVEFATRGAAVKSSTSEACQDIRIVRPTALTTSV